MRIEKQRQDFGARGSALYVVAVPIGNVEDLSERARRVLSQVSGIFCEDTRKTGLLLKSLGISAPVLKRWDVHFEKDAENRVRVIEQIQESDTAWALVTDAGTPGVQDPGAALVRAARSAGIAVIPVPGPSSITTFLSGAGLEGSGFCFRGFFPRSQGDRQAELDLFLKFSGIERNWIYFESPERILESLRFLSQKAPLELQWSGAKELTKIHECWMSGAPGQVLTALEKEDDEKLSRGEWIFAVSLPNEKKTVESEGSSHEWKRVLKVLMACNVPASEASRRISDEYRVAKNAVYAEALTLKKEN